MKRTLIFILLTWSNTMLVQSQNEHYEEGDIILGGIFPIYEKKEVAYKNCSGKFNYEDGIEAVEAFKLSIEEVNNKKIIDGVKLGSWIFDSCNNPHYALTQSLNFFKGFAESVPSDFTCTYNTSRKHKTISVIGAHTTEVTKEIAGMMSAFAVPLISYMATSTVLADKLLYPHFFRTVPNDKHVGEAILMILKQLRWNYSSIIYSSTAYGIDGYESLVAAKVHYEEICFGPSHIITDNFEEQDYQKILDKLYSRNHPPVVIAFAEKKILQPFFNVLRTKNTLPPFTWIFSDAVMYKRDPNQSLQMDKILEGAILVYPKSQEVKDFTNHLAALVNGDHSAAKTEWAKTFFQSNSQCKENVHCKDTKVTLENYQQNKYLSYIREAVYAVAYATKNAINSKCEEKKKRCDYTDINGTDVLRHLKNVSFKEDRDVIFKFRDETDGPIRYSISIIQKADNGSYELVDVGSYYGEREFKLDTSKIKYRRLDDGSWKNFPTIHCSCKPSCEVHQIRKSVDRDSPCKICEDCDEYERVENGIRCIPCHISQKPTKDRLSCELLPEQSMNYYDGWSITALTVSVSGLFTTMFVIYVFVVYRNTPLIRASGRESSFLSLTGIMISFFMTFIIYLEPNSITCGLVRFGIGFTYTICYASLVTKIIRIHRIFNNDKNVPRKLRYTSPRSQLIITGVLILTEVVIVIIWMWHSPPQTQNKFPVKGINLKICVGLDNASYLVGLGYPFLLIVISTIYAIKIRKCPDGFNEAAYIGFTNYTTIILWLSFIPIYLHAIHYAKRVLILAISLSFNGWVQLMCLFGPKLYIVLIRPEKNTKELVLTTTKVNYPQRSVTAVVMLRNPDAATEELSDRIED